MGVPRNRSLFINYLINESKQDPVSLGHDTISRYLATHRGNPAGEDRANLQCPVIWISYLAVVTV
ncbi:MAG: hypothetical protein QF609_07640, partial [Gammaproteobacteria bacterium]|nr:hypothetical protein [Gammaproteobacteria bacterium]